MTKLEWANLKMLILFSLFDFWDKGVGNHINLWKLRIIQIWMLKQSVWWFLPYC